MILHYFNSILIHLYFILLDLLSVFRECNSVVLKSYVHGVSVYQVTHFYKLLTAHCLGCKELTITFGLE